MFKWITPQNAPSTTRGILLVVPDDEEFEAIIRGALAELLDPQNYEVVNGLSVDETLDAMTPAILTTLDWVEP